ncbi:hypothetical protein LTR37_006388 [Vermiconidia calcicola]|uniref:Uncharacterized protein n=1 Tax=Vermiconidia calcicola TaxID=1690605 RepID=A0ACC3NGR7_9PEZI|nr:hypothetical protein LTR37_006388 [Vermiconidia calcicola]
MAHQVPSTADSVSDTRASDPGLLKKHSTFESYTTRSGYTYPRIRTFYKRHDKATELPNDLPLLVFMHGLGGSAAQFAPLMTSLINIASCLAFDLPGCGLSEFEPGYPGAYTTQSLAELLYAAITRFRDDENGQKVVFVGHSMGCSINALLASSTSQLSQLLEGAVVGVIAICPRGALPTPKEATLARRFTMMPTFLFDLLRQFDRRGGLFSASVTRVVGSGADDETRKMQLNYNEQSESGPFLRIMGAGLGPDGLPGKAIWSGIKVPLFLVAGDADGITPALEAENIAFWLKHEHEADQDDSGHATAPAVPAIAGDTSAAQKQITISKSNADPPRTQSGSVIKDDYTSTKHASTLKTTIFPEPAAHGLLYSTSTVRILSGMIENFLSHHVDEHMSASWQMNALTKSGKWDVKNLKKWQSVDPCSAPIGGVFRAMKTMREVDDSHSPKEFAKRFSHRVIPDGVAAVIDISHETPVYHPQGLVEAGIEYHKFPTVSKEKPKAEEVDQFIKLVDSIREDSNFHSSSAAPTLRPTIGVHCHYGFNRTGFFIVCYLVERESYKLQDAIDEFAEKRPPRGIKHEHFLNELYVRYAVNIERQATITE